MKKIYSFALILLTLLSCVVFSACGNKYEDLKMKIYSSDGQALSSVNFMIDSAKDSSQILGVEFSGVDKEDIGKIVVNSVPQELITVTNYSYSGKRCYVTIMPNMSSGENSKLVVTHIASGKKKTIDLVIDKKSTGITLNASEYAIAIPEIDAEPVEHIVEASKIVNLLPSGSTDDVYFKLAQGASLSSNIQGLFLQDVEGYSDVLSGFRVAPGVDSFVDVYPVTYMHGYKRQQTDPYKNQVIRIHFKNALTSENVKLKDEVSQIDLIANDDVLNEFKLSLVKEDGESLLEKNYYNFYNISAESSEILKVSTVIDSNKDVVVMANTHTEDFVDVVVKLEPTMLGNLETIEKVVKVKAHSKADKINVKKMQEEVTNYENINIFDYYDDGGNSLGALFDFEPIAFSGNKVHEDLSSMKLYVKPEILSEENCRVSNGVPATANNTLYSLVIHHISLTENEPFKEAAVLKFTYENDMMVSEEITENSKIYIKYIKNSGNLIEPDAFELKVETVNKSENELWKDMENTKVTLNFNRLEGVKNVDIEAGFYYEIGVNTYSHELARNRNPEYVYIDRNKGLDYVDPDKDDSIDVYYINITSGSVEGVNGGKITAVDLTVKVEPLQEVENPIKLYDGYTAKDGATKREGVNSIEYSYNINSAYSDIVTLVFRADTSLGDYRITFYQERIKKASLICRVYQSLSEMTQEYVDFETNRTAFKNEKYTDKYHSQYIVASGQNLNLSVNLPKAVLDSNIVDSYKFTEFEIVDTIPSEFDEPINIDSDFEHFNVLQDDEGLSSAVLEFIKGTFIEDKIQYVNLKITVYTKTFEDITQPSNELNDDNYIYLTFFIYEEIDSKEISISSSSMTRYMSDYLGVYYQDKSQAQLTVNMDEEKWNYVTAENKIDWRINNSNYVEDIESEYSCSYKFNSSNDGSNYERTVSAFIHQFDNIFELRCVFFVEKPILTERVIIESDVYENKTEGLYINLKKGERYEIRANNFSPLGDVTNSDIIIQVADSYGKALTAYEYFDIDQTNSRITVKKVDNTYDFTLIVFAKDVLDQQILPEGSGYERPSDFIKNDFSNPMDKNRYLNAYVTIKIHLSDGTIDNPYEIHTREDFWAIDDSDELKKAHYILMNNISLDNLNYEGSRVIENFAGSISTYNNETFTIDGITLNATNQNIFKDFRLDNLDEEGVSGVIKNVRFVARYEYDITKTNEYIYLGLFNKNGGTLENVKVQVSGYASLKGSATYFFGGLAGENIKSINAEGISSNGITYDSGYGVVGSIKLSGDENAIVHFGGLVGKNTYIIKGYEESDEVVGADTIEINSSSGTSNAISMIEIGNKDEESFIGNSNSSIGGVVGLNTFSGSDIGTIQDVYVQSIIDIRASNVGGVIGYNNQTSNSIQVESIDDNISINVEAVDSTNAIKNVKSTSVVIAFDNVGGIVGLDKNGIYYDCDYQILNSTSKEVLLTGKDSVGGIAGKSDSGKFIFCSVMSYNWKYEGLNISDKSTITNTSNIISIPGVADILGENNIGGIVGLAKSNPVLFDEGLISDRTLIIHSSVNAYIKASKQENGDDVGSIGGLISSEGRAVLYGAFFIGKLEGNVQYHNSMALDSNGSSAYNIVYSLNLEDDRVVCGSYKDDGLFTNWYSAWDNNIPSYWGWLANVNGGHIFVTKDEDSNAGSAPIFDLAPESIEVTVKDEYNKGTTANDKESLKRVLMLEYYDFSRNKNITEDKLAMLDEDYNRQTEILGVLDIAAKPSGLGKVIINVKSTDTTVVDINYDGALLINGVGECDLIFSSVLNNEVNKTIRVIVDYPIGDNFKITRYPNEQVKVASEENIAQNTTKQYYILTTGSVAGTTYSYKTKSNLHLQVEVSYTGVLEIEKYIQISGIETISTNDGTTSTLLVKLDDKTPFTISVLKMLEDEKFNFIVKPFVVVNEIDVYFEDLTTEHIPDDLMQYAFTLSTVKGVTNISFSYDDAIVYPNDTVYLTVQLETDYPLCPDWTMISANGDVLIKVDELKEVVTNLVNGDDTTEELYNLLLKIIKNTNVEFNIDVDRSIYNKNTKIQTITLRIEFEDMELINPENMIISLETINDELLENRSADVRFEILPQRINKIEIKNYHYKSADLSQKEQADILKPKNHGLIIIDLVPDNAYYDYLEISDVTGEEEIVFIQLESEDGKACINQDISSDGKGIKLYSYNANTSRLYVRTQISSTYSSKMHTIEVRAYNSRGIQLGESFRKQIDVKMLPEIVVSQILPDGSVGKQINSTETNSATGLYLANGVDAMFTIETKNSNSELSKVVKGTAEGYSIEHIAGNTYRLKADYDANNLYKTVTLELSAYAYMDNGDYDVTQCSLEFTIVEFVVHGVSVNNSISDLTTTEIYGYYERSIDLNFYFDKTDISYYNESATDEKFWDTEYEYYVGAENDPDLTNKEKQIYSILKALNGYDDSGYMQDENDYLILNKGKKNIYNQYVDTLNQGNVFNTPGNEQKVQLYRNQLTVEEGYDKETVDGKQVDSPKYLAVAFKLYYNSGWKVKKYNETVTADYEYVIDKNYNLRFNAVTQWDEPEVVDGVEDFLKMESGKQYILNRDLTLEKYTPLNVDLVYFDGNGYTITIHSFDTFSGITLQAGLFAQIYPNMIVKNVKVNYVSLNDDGNYTFGNVLENANGTYKVEHTDLTLGSSSITSANFGGLTPVNNGIITNCVVTGQIAVNVSVLEIAGDYQIPFNIGGMVAENTSTGYITNSRSELNIFSLANIGGFVHTNAGKIASCGVEESTTIYGYNTNLSNTIVSEIAGFALRNSGEISMSYVNLKSNKYNVTYAKRNSNTNIIEYELKEMSGGTMSAKDMSAGFVYSNSGKIYDAYIKMTKNGINNNTFAGFVYSNTGSVLRAYSLINGGSRVDSGDFMFAPPNSSGIENCVEFVVQTYSHGVNGLLSLSASMQYSKSVYQSLGFAFGDNESAVWSIKAGSLPTLVSTQELKFEDFEKTTIRFIPDNDISDGVDNSYLKPYYLSYGTKNNPYIIHNIETWDEYFDYEKNSRIMTGYYRIVKDVDFSSVGKNPTTSELIFKGNIQGNNMILNKIMLYSNEGLDSLGLFKKLQGASDYSVKNAVRNLKLNASSVWASSTNSVGLLAGIVEDFNIYNITIDSQDIVMVGKNSVGGLAGIVRGNFDLDQIYSNIGSNSTRATTLSNYAIYMSKNNNKEISKNINDVYYAGSIAGIVDGYGNLSSKYYKVQNVYVNGNIVLAGDSVGAAFGFVGERVSVNRVSINITGSIFGSQYSAGVAGENRGMIENVNVILADNIFENARYVMSGVVGLNLGGLVKDVDVQANINRTDYGYSVGGIVGRNVNGTVANSHFDGELFAYITGGIIASDYNAEIFSANSSGGGSLTIECKSNLNSILPETRVAYGIDHLSNVSLSGKTLNFMINNSNRFYSYHTEGETPSLSDVTIKNKVLGMVVGLSCDQYIINVVDNKMMINVEKTKITFNAETSAGIAERKLNDAATTDDDAGFIFLLKEGLTVDKNVTAMVESDNTIDLEDVSTQNGLVYVMYVVGSTVNSFDSWLSYSKEYVIIK